MMTCAEETNEGDILGILIGKIVASNDENKALRTLTEFVRANVEGLPLFNSKWAS